MSTAKNAQCSQIARNVERGKYVKQYKFSNFGSVADRYSMILIGVGMIIVLVLIEATYRIL